MQPGHTADDSAPKLREPSSNVNEGSQSMQHFVQEHLTSILHPIAQNVDELQMQVQTLQKDLGLTDARVYGYLDKLSGLLSDVPLLQKAAAQANADLGDLRRDHVEAKGKHTALDSDHVKTKGSLGDVANRLTTTGVNVETLQRAVEKQNTCVQRIQRTLGESTDAVEGVYSSGAEPKMADEKMEQRQLGLAQGLQTIWELSQSTANSLDKLTREFQGLQKEVALMKSDLNTRSDIIERRLDNTNIEVNKEAEILKATTAETKRNSSLVFEIQQYLNNEFVANQKKDKDVQATMDKLTQTVGNMEADVVDMKHTVGTEAEKSSNLYTQVQNLSATTDKNIFDINKNTNDAKRLDRTAEEHREKIVNVELRASELETGTQKLRDRADRAENNIGLLTITQNDHGEKLESHRAALEEGSTTQEQTNKELELTKSNVRSLHTVLGATNQTISKHANRLDLAHEYISGFGKGVQETHRRVQSGQEGMLPPKGDLSRTLPTIPGQRT